MLCIRCGHDLHPGATFCPYCGTRQPDESPAGPAGEALDAPGPVAAAPPVAPPASFPPPPTRAPFQPQSVLFMEPVLRALGDGNLFKRVFGVVLYLCALVTALAGLVAWVGVWNMLDYVGGAGVLGLLVFQLLFVVVIYMMVHTYVIRAQDAFRLHETHHPLTYLTGLAVRVFGETTAIWIGGLSLATGIAQSLVGDSLGGLGGLLELPGLFTSLGVAGVVVGLIAAFFVLMVAYWLAETITIRAEIARHTRQTSEALRARAVAA